MAKKYRHFLNVGKTERECVTQIVKEAEEAVAAAKKGQGVVAFQRDVAPAGEAQLKAVEATVDEAVKNGTTAGAMGVARWPTPRRR